MQLESGNARTHLSARVRELLPQGNLGATLPRAVVVVVLPALLLEVHEEAGRGAGHAPRDDLVVHLTLLLEHLVGVDGGLFVQQRVAPVALVHARVLHDVSCRVMGCLYAFKSVL
jgi:hypothetical protein